jgi:hypothetical protein
MRRRLGVLSLTLCLLVPVAFSRTGSHSYHARASHSARTSHGTSSSCPYYGGGHHTESHGGSYGVSGSSHNGGHYTSATGSHHYGRHK